MLIFLHPIFLIMDNWTGSTFNNSCVQDDMFNFLTFYSAGFIPMSKICGSHGNCISNFIKNHLVIFHSSCIVSCACQQCTSTPSLP